jgi:GntR family phosphonate transport system transcriptional regulator
MDACPVGRSRYTEIVDTLAGDLVGSPVGSRVASEHEIAARFGVNRAAGATPHLVVRDIRTTSLPDDVAARLDRPAGSPAHLLIRQGYINDLVLVSGWSHEWIPDDITPDGADIAVRSVESVDLILRQMAKVEPVRAWCRVSMVLPPPEVAAGLEIDADRQVWLIEGVSRDARSGRSVMCSNSWTRTENVRVIVELGAP